MRGALNRGGLKIPTNMAPVPLPGHVSTAIPIRDRHLYISTNQCLQYLIQHRHTVFKIIGLYYG